MEVQRPRVLVIRGGAIGDFILTLPAIRLLRENITGAHIEVLGYKPIVELAVAGGLADSVRSLEHGSMARLFAPGAPTDDALADYFRGFNLVVSYLYDPDGIFRGNMERIGVRTFLEASHVVEAGAGHAAEQLAEPLQKLAMFLEDPAPVLNMPAAALDQGSPRIAIHPGSGSLKKNWPTANWARLGREMNARFPQAKLALITGEAEAERGITNQLLDAWFGLDFIHWDQLPLTDLAVNLHACAAFIGHDSGVSHLAAACGLPALLFFGPTDPAVWAPRNAGVEILRTPDGDLGSLDFADAGSAVEDFLHRRLTAG